jgi:transposase-like protein
MYLYRVIDSNRDKVEFGFSERRDLTTAKRFLRKALKRHGRSERINIDDTRPIEKPSCRVMPRVVHRIAQGAG